MQRAAHTQAQLQVLIAQAEKHLQEVDLVPRGKRWGKG